MIKTRPCPKEQIVDVKERSCTTSQNNGTPHCLAPILTAHLLAVSFLCLLHTSSAFCSVGCGLGIFPLGAGATTQESVILQTRLRMEFRKEEFVKV